MVAMAELPAAQGEMFNVTADGVTSMRYVQTLAEIVGVEPDIVSVPDDVLAEHLQPVFGHLFGVRHHAIASIDKAERCSGSARATTSRTGHRATYEWFRQQGWDADTDALRDPVWGASWDFDAEAELAGEASVTEPAPDRAADRWCDVGVDGVALRRTVLPAVEDPHTRQLVIQLVGSGRPTPAIGVTDPSAEHVAALAGVLDALASEGNPMVADPLASGDRGRDAATVMTVCADVLVAALDADEAARREVARAAAAADADQLDADLAVSRCCSARSGDRCPMNDDEQRRLADYLSAQRGVPTKIVDVRRLSVGHSRAMHRVETDGGTYVVRVEQGGVFGTSSGEEFGLMRGLADAGYPGGSGAVVRADR